MLATAIWLLAGCSSSSSMNPVNWWHRQQGGKIAQDRPSPPGADQPYPNLSTVPARPAPPDRAALNELTDSLVADRTNAQHAAQSAPLADPSSPTASPNLFGVGTAPPPAPPSISTPAASGGPGTSIASASIPAVTAPPRPSAPPPYTPPKPLRSAPLERPATPRDARTTANAGPAPAAVAEPQAGPPPALPAGPPPRASAAGPAPVAMAAPAPMPASGTGPSATIVFPERTSNLSQPATQEVKAFVAKRGNATIAVTGFGDAVSSDPEAQSAALNLGLSRAQSIVEALKADGVPGSAIRVSAEASGRGASLQLLH